MTTQTETTPEVLENLQQATINRNVARIAWNEAMTAALETGEFTHTKIAEAAGCTSSNVLYHADKGGYKSASAKGITELSDELVQVVTEQRSEGESWKSVAETLNDQEFVTSSGKAWTGPNIRQAVQGHLMRNNPIFA